MPDPDITILEKIMARISNFYILFSLFKSYPQHFFTKFSRQVFKGCI